MQVLDAGYEVRFALKEKWKYDSGPVVYTESFTENSASKIYTARPSFNTTELNALLQVDSESRNDRSSVELIGELSYRIGAESGEWQSTQTLKVTVHNDVIRGGEGTPTDAADPAAYLTKDRVIEYLKAVVGLTAGGETKLDDFATVGLEAGKLVCVVDDSQDPPCARIYELVAGTDAEALPGLVRPDDYAAASNEKVWMLRNVAAGVRYDAPQALDSTQQAQARANINLIQVYGVNGSPAGAYNAATPGGDTYVEIEGEGCITVYGIAAAGGQGGPATETEPAQGGGSAALALRNIRCKEVDVGVGSLGAGEIPTTGTASALFRAERCHFESVVLVTQANMIPTVTAEDVQVRWCLIDNGVTFDAAGDPLLAGVTFPAPGGFNIGRTGGNTFDPSAS